MNVCFKVDINVTCLLKQTQGLPSEWKSSQNNSKQNVKLKLYEIWGWYQVIIWRQLKNNGSLVKSATDEIEPYHGGGGGRGGGVGPTSEVL